MKIINLSQNFKIKGIDKSYENYTICYLVRILIGTSKVNYYLYSIEDLIFDESKIVDNFDICGILIMDESHFERSKAICQKNPKLEFILKYNFDFNTYEVIWQKDETDTIQIKELDWNNNVIGLYSEISQVQDIESEEIKIENFKNLFEGLVALQIAENDEIIFLDKPDEEIVIKEKKETQEYFKNFKKFALRRDNRTKINEFQTIKLNLLYQQQDSEKQAKIYSSTLKKFTIDYLKFVFIDDLIENFSKTIQFYFDKFSTFMEKTDDFSVLRYQANYIVRMKDQQSDVNNLNRIINIKHHFHEEKIQNVHFGILHLQNMNKYIVKPSYVYFHYNQDNFKDEGWGCAYRSLQTILSWYYFQGIYKKQIPSIPEIQEIIVSIDKRDKKFINSKEWIGSIEISYVLNKLLNVDCQILNLNSGTEILNYLPVLKQHFENYGSPVMIGGGVLAYTLLGIAEDEDDPEKSQFLILDPHYKGKEDLKMITNPKQKAVYCINLQHDFDFDKLFEQQFHNSDDFDTVFSQYEQAFKKDGFNDYKRKKNFVDNFKFIQDFKYHSKKNDFGFDIGLNEFSDMDWKEFSDKYLMKFTKISQDQSNFKTVDSSEFKHIMPHKFEKFNTHFGRRLQYNSWFQNFYGNDSRHRRNKKSRKRSRQQTYKVGNYDVDITLKNYPQEKSWKNHSLEIKHQHKCASCYAFSTIGALEITYYLKHGKKLYFSEQEIIDCDEYNDGCVGGVPSYVYDYINDLGISNQHHYPYVAVKQDKCHVKHDKKYLNIDYYHVQNPVQAIEALQYGPVVVGFHVNKLFKMYKEKIYQDKDCKGELNHSVAIIGYDLTKDIPYFIAKNSWGETWGDKGYFKIAIGDVTKNSKGICMMFEHEYNVVPVIKQITHFNKFFKFSPFVLLINCNYLKFVISTSLKSKLLVMSNMTEDKPMNIEQPKCSIESQNRHKKIRKTKYIKQIYKNLYISDYQGAQRLKKLKKRNIDVIINLESTNICKNHFNDQFNYQNFPIADTGQQNFAQKFLDIAQVVNNFLNQKKKVLIHCLKGISRAPSLAIAFLMKYKNFTYDKAIAKIHHKYKKAEPNFGLELQLRQMQKFYAMQK